MASLLPNSGPVKRVFGIGDVNLRRFQAGYQSGSSIA